MSKNFDLTHAGMLWLGASLLFPGTSNSQGITGTKPYLTSGIMWGVNLEIAPGYEVAHTVPETRARDDPVVGYEFYEIDTTYRVEAGTIVMIGLRGGMSVSPWFTPYAGFTAGRGSEKGAKNRVADLMYSELGSRLNLAIPGSPVVPYLLGSIGYRSIQHQKQTTSGRTTVIYAGTEETYSGWTHAFGFGLVIGPLTKEMNLALDLSYTITSGNPKADWGRYDTLDTRRLSLGLTGYTSLF